MRCDATHARWLGGSDPRHCLRVSGAQFLSRGLQWELFVIQLFGRWGSLAAAKYVQEAPSERAGITDNQDLDDTEPQEKLTVINPASNVIHAVLVNSHESIPPEACITVCKTCEKRVPGAESDASSEEPREDAGSELGPPRRTTTSSAGT